MQNYVWKTASLKDNLFFIKGGYKKKCMFPLAGSKKYHLKEDIKKMKDFGDKIY